MKSLMVMIIASTYLAIGGINWGTNIAVGLLVAVAFIVTFGVAFGLESHQAQLDKERPSTKALAQMSIELTEMKSMVSDLAKKVDVIQKELEE
jgi:hypothetical protein